MASIVAVFAAAGAIASWVAGAWFYFRTMRALATRREQALSSWLAVIGWPFAISRLGGAAGSERANVNKALVALLAFLMVAAAATSVATNLARVSHRAANG